MARRQDIRQEIRLQNFANVIFNEIKGASRTLKISNVILFEFLGLLNPIIAFHLIRCLNVLRVTIRVCSNVARNFTCD
jgi:hypothetical protein